METLKVKLSSGAEIEVWLASFPEGHRLYKAVTRELSKYNLAEGSAENLALVLTSSEDIDEALWPCMGKAVYKTEACPAGLKINQAMFEDAKVREDLVEIQKEVLGFNLIPFSRPIALLLKASMAKDIAMLRPNAT